MERSEKQPTKKKTKKENKQEKKKNKKNKNKTTKQNINEIINKENKNNSKKTKQNKTKKKTKKQEQRQPNHFPVSCLGFLSQKYCKTRKQQKTHNLQTGCAINRVSSPTSFGDVLRSRGTGYSTVCIYVKNKHQVRRLIPTIRENVI